MWYRHEYLRSTLRSLSFGLGKPRSCNLANDASERVVSIPESRLEELLHAEVHYLATVPVRTVSMREVLDHCDARRAAKFIHSDNAKRIAVRIRMIENLYCWHRVHELVSIHEQLNSWYRSLRLVPRGAEVGLEHFTHCIKRMRAEGKDIVPRIAMAMYKYKQAEGEEYDDVFFNKWLDDFFLSKIGSNMLMEQYIACLPIAEGGKGRKTGIIDPQCDAVASCRNAADIVAHICNKQIGRAPPYVLEAYESGIHGRVESPICFSYIPSYLRYIIMELLKNSFSATVKHATDCLDLQNRPIHILVSKDERRIVVRISDCAGGIPCEVGDRIWSYLYGAAAQKGQHATNLAGYGVGLPTARLFARYLGGELEIRSFPGFGTDAYLLLPTIDAEQVENIPSK